MPLYKNISGNAGILAYKIFDKAIELIFKDGDTYLYTQKSAGLKHLNQLKKLARAGKGLSTYINKYVKDKYEKKV